MWNPDGIGWVLVTFGLDALIIAAILLFVPQVSTFLESEGDLHSHALESIRELHQAGKIAKEDFETLECDLERL